MRGKQIKQPGHLFSSERRAIGLCFLISYKHSIQVSGLSEKQKKNNTTHVYWTRNETTDKLTKEASNFCFLATHAYATHKEQMQMKEVAVGLHLLTQNRKQIGLPL